MINITTNTASLKNPMNITMHVDEISDLPNIIHPVYVKHVKSYEFTAEGGDSLYVKNISRFSGFSGLILSEEGTVFAILDRGYYVDTGLKFDVYGNAIFVSPTAVIGTLKGKGGEVLDYMGNDVEDIEIYKGDCFISHEIVNLISRYNDCDFEMEPHKLPVPSEIARFSPKVGMESLGISKDGVFISMEEYNSDNFSDHSAFLWKYTDKSYEAIKNEVGFTYRSDSGYSVSGMSFTCEENLLLLERKIIAHKKDRIEPPEYSLDFETKVKFVPKYTFENIAQGDVLSGTEILYIYNDGKSAISDNFEGITTKCNEETHTSIYLISDDNQSPDQKTVFLQFEIDEKEAYRDWRIFGECRDATPSGCVENLYPFCSDK